MLKGNFSRKPTTIVRRLPLVFDNGCDAVSEEARSNESKPLLNDSASFSYVSCLYCSLICRELVR